MDSDDDVQIKEDGIDNINEIIGINNVKEGEKKSSKTSIMTPSSGKAGMKRKHDDDDVELIEDDETIEKKTKNEITITPIPKNDDNKKESPVISVS
jgi:hypothetical protein